MRLQCSLPAPGHRLRVNQPPGSQALALAEVAKLQTGLLVVVTPDSAQAMQLEAELRFFLRDEPTPVLHFPDWETLPYDNFSPHHEIVSARLAALFELPSLKRAVLVMPVRTAMHRMAPVHHVAGRALHLRKGARFDPIAERRRLDQAGYRAVDTVMEPGEFALRGSVMDIFPMGANTPYRIDLFDDEIESLREFDPDSQRSTAKVDEVRLLPGKEFALDEKGIARFRQRFHELFSVDVRRCPLYQDVSQGHAPGGIEYYLPMFHESMSTLFDYLPDDSTLALMQSVDHATQAFDLETRQRYEDLRHDFERPILSPDQLFLTSAQFYSQLASYARLDVTTNAELSLIAASDAPELTFNARAQQVTQRLDRWLASLPDHRVLYTADTNGRREVLIDTLRAHGQRAEPVEDWKQFLSSSIQHAICVAPLQFAFHAHEANLLIIPEAALTGHETDVGKRKAKSTDPEMVLRNLTELTMGSPVVHLEHGIGRYHGLQSLEVDGQSHEFLVLEYAEGARLYVPVSSLHLISRYAGADAESAPLHRLGSDAWEKAKRKAAEKARDVAAELLDIYARRQAKPGTALTGPDGEYRRFSEQFQFEETADQDLAIQAVLSDLTAAKPMDRLICGDVGFGKTEVAMRAAYLAVQNGMQVAVLVPTTLLAQQHFDTFSDRFADWPVRIESISRLRNEKESEAIREQVASGNIDILIGTHKLLGREFNFPRLGLVIIDEEHRFGVRHKEQLKALRADVDVLTMTATPIPRTLNMAVSGIRDMSIIATPPAKRLAIKTFVHEHSLPLIREAINRELARGGQVFFLHNEVKTIATTAERIGELVPEARIGVGHGQMRPRDLEHVMSDFYHRRTNVLICTTIIETGIDVPNANTIIIDRADKFGLAQLHQLRGRVGRSSRQAYAYLLTPHRKALTTDAVKRLEAIEAAGELGIGFTLATHDLEIRGAGELLGEDQSGQMESVGFSLYMEMLQRAVNAIRAGKIPSLEDPLDNGAEVNLHAPALIPEDYLNDVHARLILYKRIASATNESDLDDLRAEIHDRFGVLPLQTQTLFRLTRLKLAAQQLGLARIDFGQEYGSLEFAKHTSISPMQVVQLVQKDPKTYRLDAGGQRLRVIKASTDIEQRFLLIAKLLVVLQRPVVAESKTHAAARERRR